DPNGREEDGFLRARDAAHLRLRADLVTLSGCGTGLGKEVRGEGVLCLAYGFHRAGARSVLMSLWDVDDRATAAVMAAMYRRMLGPRGLSVSAALRAAQTEVRRDARWSSPYFWARFVISGDPGEADARAPRAARSPDRRPAVGSPD